MARIKLKLPDSNMAAEVKQAILKRIPEAKVFQGEHDGNEHDWDENNRELTIDANEQAASDVLQDHFYPKGHDWRQFKK